MRMRMRMRRRYNVDQDVVLKNPPAVWRRLPNLSCAVILKVMGSRLTESQHTASPGRSVIQSNHSN